MLLITIGITFAMGLSFFLLYTRMKKWCTNKFRWRITGIFLIVGLIGLIGSFIFDMKTEKGLRILFSSMIVPFIYNSVDRFFKQMSEKYQKRDFLLYLRFSPDIDKLSEIGASNPHIKRLDAFFSITLLIFIVLIMFIPMIVFI